MLAVGQQGEADDAADGVAGDHGVAPDRSRQPAVGEPEQEVQGDRRQQRRRQAHGDVARSTPRPRLSSRCAIIAAASVPIDADDRPADDDRGEPVVPAAQPEQQPGRGPQGDEDGPDDLDRRRPVAMRRSTEAGAGDDDGQRGAEQAVGGAQFGARRRPRWPVAQTLGGLDRG